MGRSGQTESGLQALEALAAGTAGQWLHGAEITLADITAVIAHDFVSASAPDVMEHNPLPALAALSAKVNTMAAFAETRP
jgi:glutathione S-transferase